MSFPNRLTIPHRANDQIDSFRVPNSGIFSSLIIDFKRTDDSSDSSLRALKDICNYSPLLYALRMAFLQHVVKQQKLLYWHTRIHQRTTVATATHGAWNEFASTKHDNTEMYSSEH